MLEGLNTGSISLIGIIAATPITFALTLTASGVFCYSYRMYNFKKDKYQKARGGTSRVLDIACEKCQSHMAYYQKDGPGILKRMYVDRFIDKNPTDNELVCESCAEVIGRKITYKKEDRPAYRLFAGAVTKKVISQNKLP